MHLISTIVFFHLPHLTMTIYKAGSRTLRSCQATRNMKLWREKLKTNVHDGDGDANGCTGKDCKNGYAIILQWWWFFRLYRFFIVYELSKWCENVRWIFKKMNIWLCRYGIKYIHVQFLLKMKVWSCRNGYIVNTCKKKITMWSYTGKPPQT